ncbi:MAG: hypothetical protein WBV94_11005, partial [Blastocatellia bacterium]
MGKKKKLESETEMKALLPEQVKALPPVLAGLVEEHESIRKKAKESAREFRRQLEANEEELARLARMIITQQEEVPVRRQMTLEEIADRRRHEESIAEFERETGAFKLGRQTQDAAATADEASSPEDSPVSGSPDTADDMAQSWDAPDGNTLEGGLWRALHRTEDANIVWREYRLSGVMDGELKFAISREFGISGSNSGPGLKSISYKGGKDPSFWFDSSPPARPTLKGRALIEKAR